MSTLYSRTCTNPEVAKARKILRTPPFLSLSSKHVVARQRQHESLAPKPGRPTYIEHEYKRAGAWNYLAAWDVRRAKVFGRCEPKTGIAPFDRLVAQVMAQEPYRSAKRVFWIIDNGSAHRGQKTIARLQEKWPTIIPVHTPQSRAGVLFFRALPVLPQSLPQLVPPLWFAL